jgi:hypothetical protein
MTIKVFNNITNKFNSLATAKRNGLYETPTNFRIPSDSGLNLQSKRLVLLKTLTSKINKGLLQLNEVYIPNKLYNPTTKRFIMDTPKNKLKIEMVKKVKNGLINTFILKPNNIDNDVNGISSVTYFNKVLPKQIVKKHPNSVYVITATFYDKNNKEYNKLEIVFDKWDKETKKAIDLKFMMGGGSEAGWIIGLALTKKLIGVDINFEPIFQDGKASKVVLTYETFLNVPNSSINQQSALMQTYELNEEDINPHKCVYSTFIKFFECKLIKNENDVRAKQMLNRLIKKEYKLNKPYTDKNIDTIAKICNSSVEIFDPVHNNNRKFNENSMNYYNIRIINTKFNHVDLYLGDFYEPIELSQVEYDRIKETSVYYAEHGSKLYTTNCIYCKETNEYKELVKELNDEYNMNNKFMPINDINYTHIMTYDYSTHVFFKEPEQDDKLYKELDVKKAYYNFNKFEEYVGMPSGSFITMSNNDGKFCNDLFIKQYDNKLVGFYTIKITTTNNHFMFLGFNIDSIHTLYTPSIKFLIDNKIEFDYITMSVSPSFHFEFNEKWTNKMDDVAHYCRYFGNLMQKDENTTITIKSKDDDKRYYSIICNKEYSMYVCDNIIKLIKQHVRPKTNIHIAYAIHSMTKLQIMKQLLKSNIDDVVGVKIDSIVYKENTKFHQDFYDETIFNIKESNLEKMINNIKRVKEGLDFSAFDEGITLTGKFEEPTKMMDVYKCYLFSEIDEEQLIKLYKVKSLTSSFLQTNEYITNRIIFCGGKGGSGKTHNLLYNKSIDYDYLCYSSFTNNLITQKYLECVDKKMDIIPATIYKLLGDYNNKKIDKITRKIKYILIDEATLISNILIEKVIEEYTYCYIFVLGDIKNDGTFYQCTTLQPKNIFNPSKYNLQYVEYNKTYRFDAELDTKLNKLRVKMDEYRKYGGNAMKVLEYWFIKEWKDRIFDIKDINMKNNDIGISCTNDLSKKSSGLNEYFAKKGVKMHYFIKSTNLKKNEMAWQQLDYKPNHKNFIETRFRTIHSFQGLELDYKQNIIICLDNLFDYNLIYTALSRSRSTAQIYIFMVAPKPIVIQRISLNL